MCTLCLPALNAFRATTTRSPWTLSREVVADRLQELINEPDTIRQGSIGFCGPAAFIRAWLLNDHMAVLNFAFELYNTGKGHIGNWGLEPCGALLACDHAHIPWDGEAACPAAEWMMMAAIQDQENTFRPDYTGQLSEAWWREGLIPWDVANLFSDTGLYSAVDNRTAAVPWNPVDDNSTDDAVTLVPDDRCDVVMLINASLIASSLIDLGVWGFFNNNVSNHYIGLRAPPVRVQKDGVDSIRLRFNSWGRSYDETYPTATFDANYYGAIVAHARLPKTLLPDTVPSLPTPPRDLRASLATGQVRLDWHGASLNDIEVDIERFRTSEGRWIDMGTLPSPRPSNLAQNWTDTELIIAAASADTVWYRVRPRNAKGSSAWSAPVMVSLPSGASRTTDPERDADIRCPPCFVSRVSVLRAPAGLLPGAYGSFDLPASACQAPQWVYDARWYADGTQWRQLEVDNPRSFRPDREAYVFVQFANAATASGVVMEAGSVAVRLTGARPDRTTMSIALAMQPGPDGSFHWGRFAPESLSSGYTLAMAIDGRDAAPRYAPRQPDGHQIDSAPASSARPQLDQPPLFPFTSYTPGTDHQHRLSVGMVPATVAGELEEPNDSPTRATVVPLVGEPAFADLDQQAISPPTDADWFRVDYISSAVDDANHLSEPVTEPLSGLLGLSLVHYPPMLILALAPGEGDPVCMDIAAYKSDGVQRTHELPRCQQLVIHNPTQAFYPDRTLYLRLRSSDPLRQGAFTYRLHLRYQHAHDDYRMNANAPAFKARSTQARALLRRLYERLDLPRPGADYKTRPPVDSRVLVQRTAAFMLDAQNKADLMQVLGEHPASDLAADYRMTARVAVGLGLQAEAEGLLKAAAGRAGMAHDAHGQVAALEDLHGIYVAAGKATQAERVSVKITQVKLRF